MTCTTVLSTQLSLVRRAIMRAVRVHEFGGPEVMKVESGVKIPVPGDNQVLIKVHASGVNPIDTYIRSGAYVDVKVVKGDSLPYIPGTDASGVVEAVGKGVTNFKKGDRVYSGWSESGVYCEYAVSDALHTGHLSDKLTFSQGAAVGAAYYTAYHALVHGAKIRPGETVLVHGASGAVGLGCVQLAKSLGLRVLGTAGSPEGLKLIKSNGASDVFSHREEGYTAKITAATGGQGPDVIVEMLANVNLQKDLDMAKFQCRIVLIGSRGTIEVDPLPTLVKELQVIGIGLPVAAPAEWKEMHAFLEAGAEVGWLKSHVGKEYTLDQVAAAHHDVINNTGTMGKLVLTL